MEKEFYGKNTRPARWWQLVIADLLLAGAAILLFAYFHHVRPVEGEQGVVITPPPMPPVTSEGGNQSGGIGSDTPSGEPDYSYLGLGEKFYGKFNLDNSVTYTDTAYTSGRLHIEITSHRYESSVIHVADIYMCDIVNYGSVFADDKFGKNFHESVTSMAKRSNSILAVNGDYYGTHFESFLVRNGVLYYNTKPDDDICVLYSDGRMETYFEEEFDKDKAIEQGAWQAFGFGPKLMENGKALKSGNGFTFNSGVATHKNPRTAIGYYEPGHYCLVFVEGRSDTSEGLTMNELAAFMEKIGCTDAFNLDGGKTSSMYFMGKLVGEPYEGGRECSDIISITDLSAAPVKKEN